MSVVADTESPAGVVVVDSADVPEIEKIARDLLAVGRGRVDDPEWVAAARQSWDDLPAGLRRSVREFRRDSGLPGALLVRGLPVAEAELPPTPSVEGSVQRSATVPAGVLLMIAAGLGDPAAFRAEKSGALVQDVVPVPGKEDFQGNAGSVLLSFHNENAFHPHRPDFVMLLCLRSDHEGVAGLRTGCIREALPLLGDRSRDLLAQPEFVTQPPPSFGSGGGDTAPHAVLGGTLDDPSLQVDFAATRPLTEQGAAAMAELQEIFGRTARTHYLSPGDLAIVDNRVTVHGRTAFRPRYDGRDRWLQRTFSLTDLRRSRAYRPNDGYVLES